MERRKLGQLEVSAIGLGCATMTPFYGEPDPTSAIETIRRAPELGIDFLDTSDAYGNGRNEELISRAVEGRRQQYVIASKFGNLRRTDGTPTPDGRPEYVKAACDRSLGRLHTEIIDLYYIHRVDPTVPIEDTVGAMSDLVRDGKVRFLGISEAGPQTIRRAHATYPMSAVQIEYSLWTRDVEGEILGLCNELGIGFVAYSPLGRGFLTGTVTGRGELRAGDARLHMPRFHENNLPHNLELVTQLRHLAESEGCTPAQLALAWVLSRGRSIVPIAGTSHRRWLEENAAAADLQISAARGMLSSGFSGRGQPPARATPISSARRSESDAEIHRVSAQVSAEPPLFKGFVIACPHRKRHCKIGRAGVIRGVPMKIADPRIAGACAAMIALTACVAPPVAPTIPVAPGPNKTFDAFAADQAVCQQYAAAQTSPSVAAANNQAVGGALLSSALGAGLGAAIGAAAGSAGTGAAIGAASGAAFGGVANAGGAPYAQMSLQQQYDVLYGQCMTAHGNSVPGFSPPQGTPPYSGGPVSPPPGPGPYPGAPVPPPPGYY